MTDYIKREDAVDVIARCAKTEDVVEGYPVGKWDEYVEYAKERLSEVPSADVAPVRHGRLVDAGISASGHRLTMCTICKRKMREGIEIGIVSRYCPNCGVRLDEEAEK